MIDPKDLVPGMLVQPKPMEFIHRDGDGDVCLRGHDGIPVWMAVEDLERVILPADANIARLEANLEKRTSDVIDGTSSPAPDMHVSPDKPVAMIDQESDAFKAGWLALWPEWLVDDSQGANSMIVAEPGDCGADLTTLSTLLGSQEARDAAPCVPVTGPWVLRRDGALACAEPVDELVPEFRETGRAVSVHNRIRGDCIWSGDLPALLSALVAERDGLRKLVEAAYREGLHEGYNVRYVTPDEDWERSNARSALKALKEQQP